MPEISVLMITLNEENAIEKVIRDIQRSTAGRDVEIVVVDSSKDKTPQIAERLGARVVRQFPPQGYGRAMERALGETRGVVAVTLDCDDTYPTNQILPIADQVLRGETDLVNASRLGTKPEAMPWPNYLANVAFCVLARILVGVKTTDLHSGMRAYSKRLLNELTFDGSGPALPVELMLKPVMLGFRVSEIFIEYRERVGTSTLQKWSSTVWTLRRILRCVPMRFGSTPAAKVRQT